MSLNVYQKHVLGSIQSCVYYKELCHMVNCYSLSYLTVNKNQSETCLPSHCL